MRFFAKHGSGKGMVLLGFIICLAACDNSQASSEIVNNSAVPLSDNTGVTSPVNDNKVQDLAAVCSFNNKAWWPLPQGKNDVPPNAFITRVDF